MFLRLLTYFIPSFVLTYSIYYVLNPTLFNQLSALAFLLVISWTLGYYFFEHFNQENIDPKNKIVVVTGCDTGFGNRVAFRLDQLGFHVYAGVLFPDGEGAQSLKEKCSDRLKVVKMDVTKREEVDNIVKQVKDEKIPLWAIINNAGVGYSAPFDWGDDLEVYEKTFNVNIYGVARVTKSFSALLRKNRGRIVNVASVAGRIPAPWISHYCMAKHSVRVYSDIIRRELVGTGVKVICLEPSFYRTQIINFDELDRIREKIYRNTPKEIQEHYGENFLNYLSHTNKIVNKNTKEDLDEVTDAMINGVMKKYPKIYYRCGSYLELFTLWGASHLPEIIVDVFLTLMLSAEMRSFKCGIYQDKKTN